MHLHIYIHIYIMPQDFEQNLALLFHKVKAKFYCIILYTKDVHRKKNFKFSRSRIIHARIHLF